MLVHIQGLRGHPGPPGKSRGASDDVKRIFSRAPSDALPSRCPRLVALAASCDTAMPPSLRPPR